jgi:methyl-accepting chemotaxis protein
VVTFGIRERLLCSTGCLVAASLLTGVYAVFVVDRIDDELRVVTEQAEPSSLLLLNLDRDSYQAQLGLERVVYDPASRAAGLEMFEENSAQVLERFELYRERSLVQPGESDAQDEVEGLRADWMEKARAVLGALDSADVATLLSVERSAYSLMRERIDTLFGEYYEHRVEELSAAAATDARSAGWTIGGAVLVIGVLTGTLALWIGRHLRPLRELGAVARRIAGGDVRSTVTVQPGHDEVAELSASFAEMSAFLSEVGATLQVVAKGDLTQRFATRGADDALGASVGEMVEGLRDVMRNLTHAVERVRGAAQALGNVSSTLEHSIEGSLQHASEIAQATNAMNSSIRSIHANVQDVSRAAAGAEQRAIDTAGIISRLHASGNEIGKVTNVIHSIAEQTNLLALNATIESARAGVYGRGFSVVAAEVKQLASATAGATEQVRGMITTLQGDLTTAVESVAVLADTIVATADQVSKAAEALAAQEHAASDIAGSARAVAEATEGTRSSGRLAKETADKLQELAVELGASVSRFRV